jgi:hypothetical protein
MKNIQNMKRLLSLTVSQLLAKDQLGNTGYTVLITGTKKSIDLFTMTSNAENT